MTATKKQPDQAYRTVLTADTARKYAESPQFAVDMQAIAERAKELARDIEAMRRIAMAMWR